ncbi:MAG: hypothetical protein ACLGHP_12245, partial [Vicinamibacteria bacterium]
NVGAQLARGRVLVSLDDDAELPSPRTVRQTLAAFDDERIGVVTLPLEQPAWGEQLFQAAPEPGGTRVRYAARLTEGPLRGLRLAGMRARLHEELLLLRDHLERRAAW